MSLVKVGVFGASAAEAMAGTNSPALNRNSTRFIGGSSLLDRHFHVGVGPAALKPSTALARFIVGLHAQQIVAGGGKRRIRADHVALLRHREPRLLERHLPGPAEVVQRDRRGGGRAGEA